MSQMQPGATTTFASEVVRNRQRLDERKKVKIIIFACVHNAGRSQMAAAFFNKYADQAKAHAISAGTQPADCIHPEVVQMMSEVGIDLSQGKPQKLTDELAREAGMLITMGLRRPMSLCPWLASK